MQSDQRMQAALEISVVSAITEKAKDVASASVPPRARRGAAWSCGGIFHIGPPPQLAVAEPTTANGARWRSTAGHVPPGPTTASPCHHSRWQHQPRVGWAHLPPPIGSLF
jgi:hypothetical protein